MKAYIYQGLGNSFLIGEFDKGLDLSDMAKQYCSKYHLDGLINYQKENNKMQIYNQDGSKALMCGNGIRCLANYLYQRYQINNVFSINTDAGIKNIEITSYTPFCCKVNLGRPHLIKELNQVKKIKVDHEEVFFNSLFLSTFQILILVDNVNDFKIDSLAEKIYLHPLFKEKCNITFYEIVDYKTIKTRTYERGVGFSLSCATGASSAAYIGYLLYKLSKKITVIQPLGKLSVTIDNQIYIEGVSSFEKEVEIND